MANQHITAAYRCSHFKGTAREVLLYLANCASPGPGEHKKNLPLGYCKRKLATIMCALNIHRQPTITKAITQLKAAGVIKQRLKRGASPLYFVDLDWLKEHEYTDDQIESFDYDALRESREKETRAEQESVSLPDNLHNFDVDDLFPDEFIQRRPFNQEASYGEPMLALGDPLASRVSLAAQREAINLDNGNRLTSETESVAQNNGKRLTPSHLFPPAEAGTFPPTGVGSFPPASRNKADEQPDASLDTFGETKDFVLDQHRETLDPKSQKQPLSAIAPHPPVHPAAQLIDVPPALAHRWPPLRERQGDTICLRPGCTVTYDDWRFQRDECQGEAEEATNA